MLFSDIEWLKKRAETYLFWDILECHTIESDPSFTYFCTLTNVVDVRATEKGSASRKIEKLQDNNLFSM